MNGRLPLEFPDTPPLGSRQEQLNSLVDEGYWGEFQVQGHPGRGSLKVPGNIILPHT
jgi:hypothetical protein